MFCICLWSFSQGLKLRKVDMMQDSIAALLWAKWPKNKGSLCLGHREDATLNSVLEGKGNLLELMKVIEDAERWMDGGRWSSTNLSDVLRSSWSLKNRITLNTIFVWITFYALSIVEYTVGLSRSSGIWRGEIAHILLAGSLFWETALFFLMD